jgi:membrane protein implicated in regulation of membrane protease activity
MASIIERVGEIIREQIVEFLYTLAAAFTGGILLFAFGYAWLIPIIILVIAVLAAIIIYSRRRSNR